MFALQIYARGDAIYILSTASLVPGFSGRRLAVVFAIGLSTYGTRKIHVTLRIRVSDCSIGRRTRVSSLIRLFDENEGGGGCRPLRRFSRLSRAA